MIRKKLFLTSALALGIVSSLTGCSTVDGKTDTTFQTTDAAFPSWNSPDPSAYTWTLPDTSHWWNFGKNVSQDVLSFIANTMLDLVAWIMHIAILVSSKFSDPTWITDPVTAKVADVFKAGYEDIFMKFLPVLVMITVGYLAWKYVVAHHAKMLTGIISTVLASGLIAFFFFDFGDAFKWVDGAGNLITNTASSAVASAAGTPVGSEYDTLWNNYILYPWEYGQFGQISGNISDFNVNVSAMQQNGEDITWHPDPTPGNPSPDQIDLKEGDNWVKLFLQNTSQQSRDDLEADLTKCANDNVSPFKGAKLTAAALSNANPYAMIPFMFIEMLLIITPVVFLVYVGFQLFVRELLFIVTIMMGLVTVPMAFIPEIGWRITFNWIREAVGHQVERVSNAIYAALLFSVAGIITTSVGNSEAEMMLAFLIDAILFAAALLYRQKVFSVAVHPLSDAARDVDTHHRMTMDEWAQHQHEREQHERHRVPEDKHSRIGKLAEHFEHAAEIEHAEYRLPHGRRGGDVTVARGSDEQPQFMMGEEKPVSKGRGSLASHFADHANKTSRLSQVAGQLGQTARGRIKDHVDNMSHPGCPLTQEERIRWREHRARLFEQQLHAAAVGGLAATLRQVSRRKLAEGFESPDVPPGAPPADGSGPADSNVDDKDYHRVTMTTPDGQMSQGVILDKDGKEIAVEPRVPRRNTDRVDDDGTDGGQPALADGFSVPIQDSVSEPGTTRLEAEKPAYPKGETDTLVDAQKDPVERPTPENDTLTHAVQNRSELPASETTTPVSTRPTQPQQLPDNVTRIEDERKHRTGGEGRQREQRQRRSQGGQRRTVVKLRVNDRTVPRRTRGDSDYLVDLNNDEDGDQL